MCGVKPPDQRRQKVSGGVGRDLPFSPTQSLQVMRWHWPPWLQCPQINMNHQTSCRHQPSPPSPPPLRKILKMFIVFVIGHKLHNIWGESIFKTLNYRVTIIGGESLKEIILRDRNVSFAFIWCVRGNFHTTSQCVLTTLTSSMMNSISAWSLFYKHPSPPANSWSIKPNSWVKWNNIED